MRNAQLLEKIDAAIAEKSLLKHPFYQDWQMGKLNRQALQLYAAQYYRHVEAFPSISAFSPLAPKALFATLSSKTSRKKRTPRGLIPNSGAISPPPSASMKRTSPRARRFPARKLSSKPSARLWEIVRSPRQSRHSTPTNRRCPKSLRQRLKAYRSSTGSIPPRVWPTSLCMRKPTRPTARHGVAGSKSMPLAMKRKS